MALCQPILTEGYQNYRSTGLQFNTGAAEQSSCILLPYSTPASVDSQGYSGLSVLALPSNALLGQRPVLWRGAIRHLLYPVHQTKVSTLSICINLKMRKTSSSAGL
jgi:hypothetical protein